MTGAFKLAVLGIDHHNKQQLDQHISSAMIQDLWGNLETVTTKITIQKMEWLGHVACMPKIAVFWWLPQTCPPEEPRKRWKDQVRKDLKSLDMMKQNT